MYPAAALPQALRLFYRGVVDKAEARGLLAEQLAALQKRSYADLRDTLLDKPATFEVVGASGIRYQLEMEAVWDSGKDGPLRVFAAIDDGGSRSFVPMTESLIVPPNPSPLTD
jgi:hypothetical protein